MLWKIQNKWRSLDSWDSRFVDVSRLLLSSHTSAQCGRPGERATLIPIPDPYFRSSLYPPQSSYSAPQSSSPQICQEKYPLQGWKSMKFQIQSQSDKMSLLAYLAWIEHSSGAPCLRLIWSRAYLCTKGPLLRSSPPTDNLGKSLHTKPNVSDDQKKSAHNQNALPNLLSVTNTAGWRKCVLFIPISFRISLFWFTYFEI